MKKNPDSSKTNHPDIAGAALHSRRDFLERAGLLAGSVAAGLTHGVRAAEKPIQGLEKVADDPNASKGWRPVSDRRIRVGIVGYGVCQFGAAFGFQDHPNVEVVAVSDLIPERCAALAKACRCAKTLRRKLRSSSAGETGMVRVRHYERSNDGRGNAERGMRNAKRGTIERREPRSGSAAEKNAARRCGSFPRRATAARLDACRLPKTCALFPVPVNRATRN